MSALDIRSPRRYDFQTTLTGVLYSFLRHIEPKHPGQKGVQALQGDDKDDAVLANEPMESLNFGPLLIRLGSWILLEAYRHQ